jgi:hypothetical protein
VLIGSQCPQTRHAGCRLVPDPWVPYETRARGVFSRGALALRDQPPPQGLMDNLRAGRITVQAAQDMILDHAFCGEGDHLGVIGKPARCNDAILGKPVDAPRKDGSDFLEIHELDIDSKAVADSPAQEAGMAEIGPVTRTIRLLLPRFDGPGAYST